LKEPDIFEFDYELSHKSDINLKVIVMLLKSNQDMSIFKNKICYENFLFSKVIYFIRRTR